MTDKDRAKVVFDKYLRGKITISELNKLLEVMQPKDINPNSELTGYA